MDCCDNIGKALKEIGVRLRNDDESYRSLVDVLGDISKNMSTEPQHKIDDVAQAMSTEVIVIDKNEDFDKHLDYKYIARSIATDKLIIGYLNVDKPWYSDESCWDYSIRYQEYFGSYGNSTWSEELVYKDSIMPYTRNNYEIYAKEHNMRIRYITDEEYKKELFGE